MKTNKIHTLAYTLSFIIIATITGCSDSSEEKSAKKESLSNVVETSKIEVVENKDAHAIKVKSKTVDKNQSKSYYYDYNIKSEYDQNAQPANEDASVRVKPRTTIDANMNIRSPYEKVKVSMLVKRLSKDFILRCSACHNDYGNGVIGPSLLGKDYNYIYTKIIAFKTGKTSNPLMNDLVKMMTDEEIQKLAREIFQFNEEINKMRNK